MFKGLGTKKQGGKSEVENGSFRKTKSRIRRIRQERSKRTSRTTRRRTNEETDELRLPLPSNAFRLL